MERYIDGLSKHIMETNKGTWIANTGVLYYFICRARQGHAVVYTTISEQWNHYDDWTLT